MIRAFTFDGQTIPIQPSPLFKPHGKALFAGDSMTLLVGPNGCGKTRALVSLASTFSGATSNDKNISHVNWDSPQEHLETCAIYYTPVPYHIDTPKNGHRFRSIKTSLSNASAPLSTKHREIANELKAEFGLDARRTLALQNLSQRSLEDLMSRVLSSRSGVVDPWIEPFRIKYNNLLKQMREHREASAASRNRSKYELFNQQNEKLVREFSIELRKNIGQEFSLRIRAYQFSRSGRTPSSSAEKQLLEELGFTLNSAPSKQATVPRKNFVIAINLFQTIAKIINDPWLAKNTYQVDDDQVERLEALPLNKLGQVTLTGLSSGAAALIHQFSSINTACEELLLHNTNRKLLLLIDEGDAFLHLAWQQQYIDYLDKTVHRLKRKFESVQIVIASHSPILMSDFPRECIFLLNNRDWIEDLLESGAAPIPSASFGAPLDAVVRHVGQTGTMGKFAARVIRQLLKDIDEGMSVDMQRVEMIGDPIIKRQIIKTLNERQQWASEE
ncbi:AAA family ATPase [Pseudomonas psychrophila]|uniref:AAA family ATPase n=1 Tax=Pseudomonas psychrophila TaxID=122355 RepID=UPI0009E196F8|nr:AAA family ATPase [Pseudomonas psychrophila]